MDIVEQIEAKIAEHRAEIDRLESALEVIRQVSGKSSPGKAKAQQPMFTVRKAVPALAGPTTGNRGKERPVPGRRNSSLSYSEWRANVLDMLKKHGPMTSGEMAALLGVTNHPTDKQAMYNSLSQLKLGGVLEKDSKGKYLVLGTQQSQEAEAGEVAPVVETDAGEGASAFEESDADADSAEAA